MAARDLRLQVRMLAHAWPATPQGKGWPFRNPRERRCAAGRGPELAACSSVHPRLVPRGANSDLSRDRTARSARWASCCRRRVRWGSRVAGWSGLPSGDRRCVPRVGRRQVRDRRRAGRAGWRSRDRSGARAISRSMHPRRGDDPRRMRRNPAGLDPVPSSRGPPPATWTRQARAPAARPRRSPVHAMGYRPSPAAGTWTRPGGWTRSLAQRVGPAPEQAARPAHWRAGLPARRLAVTLCPGLAAPYRNRQHQSR